MTLSTISWCCDYGPWQGPLSDCAVSVSGRTSRLLLGMCFRKQLARRDSAANAAERCAICPGRLCDDRTPQKVACSNAPRLFLTARVAIARTTHLDVY
eukprot:5893966-Amphidinium_carterae.1